MCPLTKFIQRIYKCFYFLLLCKWNSLRLCNCHSIHHKKCLSFPNHMGVQTQIHRRKFNCILCGTFRSSPHRPVRAQRLCPPEEPCRWACCPRDGKQCLPSRNLPHHWEPRVRKQGQVRQRFLQWISKTKKHCKFGVLCFSPQRQCFSRRVKFPFCWNLSCWFESFAILIGFVRF